MEETDVSRSSHRDGAWRRQMLVGAATEMGHGGRQMLVGAATEMGHGGDRC